MNRTSDGRVLIDRTHMINIAREYNLFVSYSTVYRWTNEPEFPVAVGRNGKSALYLKSEFTRFLERMLGKVERDE